MFEIALVNIIESLEKAGKTEYEAKEMVAALLASVLTYKELAERIPKGPKKEDMS